MRWKQRPCFDATQLEMNVGVPVVMQLFRVVWWSQPQTQIVVVAACRPLYVALLGQCFVGNVVMDQILQLLLKLFGLDVLAIVHGPVVAVAVRLTIFEAVKELLERHGNGGNVTGRLLLGLVGKVAVTTNVVCSVLQEVCELCVGTGAVG